MKPFRVALLYFCLLLSSLSGFAQSLEWSTEERLDGHFPFMRILGQDDGGYYALRSNIPLDNMRSNSFLRRREYSMSYYDNTMQKLWTKALLCNLKDGQEERVVMLNEKPLLISSLHSNDHRISITGQWVSQSGQLSNPAIRLLQAEFTKKDQIERLQVKVSSDQSMLFIAFDNSSQKDRPHLKAYCFDEELKQIWNGDIEFPVSKGGYEIGRIVAGNDKTIYIEGLRYELRNDDMSPENSSFQITAMDIISGEKRDYPIAVDNRFITDVGFSIDYLNNKLVTAGFFSNTKDNSTAGVFYQSFDKKTGQQISAVSSPFPDPFIKRLLGEVKSERARELHNYTIDKLILRNDGGCVIAAEAFYTTVSSYYDVFTQMYTNRTDYHYNNILLISVNPDGSIHWPQVLNKLQVSTDDGGYYSSYAYMANGPGMHYYFNDFTNRKNRVSQVTVNTFGELKTKTLFSESDQITLIPKAGIQIDENVIIIPAEKDKRFAFLKISF